MQVKHALSVSLNKLGDLQHWSGQIASALGCYTAALALRRELVEVLGTDASNTGSVSRTLDLAVSLVKVSGAQLAVNNDADTTLLMIEARELAAAVVATDSLEDKATVAKLKSIQAYLGTEARIT